LAALAELGRPRWTLPPNVRLVMLHGLNPFGFAWLRRTNEDNIDPNRNFHLAAGDYQGCEPNYRACDRLLNPRRAPRRIEPFAVQVLWAALRFGHAGLKQAIAAGQYEFPLGLFFGGKEPSQTHAIVAE